MNNLLSISLALTALCSSAFSQSAVIPIWSDSGTNRATSTAFPLPVTVVSGGGGGGAVTIADGADVTQGAIADASVSAGATGTLSAKLRRLSADIGTITGQLPASLGIKTAATSFSIAPASDASFAVTGTFWQATQPVSLASVPSHAVTNAGTFATQASITTLGAAAPASAVPVIQATATTVVSTALEASHVGKASAGSLVSLHVFNTKASAQYILIMNSTTVPADGAVTLLYPPIYIPATSNASLQFPTPLTASTGISVCNSSTGTFTKTVGSADCVFTIQVQ